jgi:hypothetical protein
MTEAIDIVTAALRKGTIPSLEEAIDALVLFEDALREDFTLEFDYKSLTAVKSEADLALDRIRQVAQTHHIHFDISTTGTIPTASSLPASTNTSTMPAIPMAAGGDFMVTRPTLFLAGEAGPERATFTPMAGGNGRSEGVTINGPLVQVESVTDMAMVDELAIQTAELIRSYRR